MKDSDPVNLVENGYDEIAHTYHEQRGQFHNLDLLRDYAALLPPGGRVLDAGCGAGVPVARFLVEAGFTLTGVDISAAMLDLARLHVPQASFYKMDMRDMSFPESSFTGISAFYSLFHIPQEDHGPVLKKFQRSLRPGGVLLFCTGVDAWQGVDDFYGKSMYWSHPGGEATRQLVVAAGFTILLSEVREYGGEKQYWIMAEKG